MVITVGSSGTLGTGGMVITEGSDGRCGWWWVVDPGAGGAGDRGATVDLGGAGVVVDDDGVVVVVDVVEVRDVVDVVGLRCGASSGPRLASWTIPQMTRAIIAVISPSQATSTERLRYHGGPGLPGGGCCPSPP